MVRANVGADRERSNAAPPEHWKIGDMVWYYAYGKKAVHHPFYEEWHQYEVWRTGTRLGIWLKDDHFVRYERVFWHEVFPVDVDKVAELTGYQSMIDKYKQEIEKIKEKQRLVITFE